MGFSDAGSTGPGPDDLVLAVSGARAEAGLAAAEEMLDALPPAGVAPARGRAARRAAWRAREGDLAVISVPGDYAALEAHKALGSGMDVLLFSDGVSLEDEVALKRRPTSGASSSWGRVRARRSSTGWRSVRQRRRARLGGRGRRGGHRRAGGHGARRPGGRRISRCYGTGGRDLTDEVGGSRPSTPSPASTPTPSTDVILCVSKPPSPEVAERVLRALAASGPAAVACMVGGGVEPVAGSPGRDPRGGGPRRRPARRPPVRAPGPAPRRVGHAAAPCAACSPADALQRGRRDPGRAPRDRGHQRAGRPGAAPGGRATGPRVPRSRRGGVHPRAAATR